MPTSGSTLGERLKLALGAETQRAFAGRLGLGESMISLYCADKVRPTYDRARDLALALSVRVEWLLDGEGPMRPNEVAPIRLRDGGVEYPLIDDDLRSLGIPAAYAGVFPSKDDSMLPAIPNGIDVVADMRVREFQSDGIYVLKMPDESIAFRRLMKQPDGRVTVSCDNKAFDSRVRDLVEARVTVLGRARGIPL